MTSSRFEVDNELELGRLLDRKVRRLRASVCWRRNSCAPKSAGCEHQTTVGAFWVAVDRRQTMAGREFGHSCAVDRKYALGRSEAFGTLVTPLSKRPGSPSLVRTSWICSVTPNERAAFCNA